MAFNSYYCILEVHDQEVREAECEAFNSYYCIQARQGTNGEVQRRQENFQFLLLYSREEHLSEIVKEIELSILIIVFYM